VLEALGILPEEAGEDRAPVAAGQRGEALLQRGQLEDALVQGRLGPDDEVRPRGAGLLRELEEGLVEQLLVGGRDLFELVQPVLERGLDAREAYFGIIDHGFPEAKLSDGHGQDEHDHAGRGLSPGEPAPPRPGREHPRGQGDEEGDPVAAGPVGELQQGEQLDLGGREVDGEGDGADPAQHLERGPGQGR